MFRRLTDDDWEQIYQESAWTRREVRSIRRMARFVGLWLATEIQLLRSGNALRRGWAKRWED